MKKYSFWHFALLCILESVSYTRKDGQYVRCDYRSGRTQGKKRFTKGYIADFSDAISAKFDEILADLQPVQTQAELFPDVRQQGEITLLDGSCRELMPKLTGNYYGAIITSPPYCNRYGYTRTCALELALLGVDKTALVRLRQEMFSCTLENRAKDLCRMNPDWQEAVAVPDAHDLLQAILVYLESQRVAGGSNNSGIVRW